MFSHKPINQVVLLTQIEVRRIWWRETDSNHRRQCRQIYSLLPLATREPLQGVSYSSQSKPKLMFSHKPINQVVLLTQIEVRRIWWRETDSNHRRQCRQIYSLLPLATREPLQGVSYSSQSKPKLMFSHKPINQVVLLTQIEVRRIWWRETDSNHRRQCRQIYSLLPLATREPLQGVSYSSQSKPKLMFSHKPIN